MASALLKGTSIPGPGTTGCTATGKITFPMEQELKTQQTPCSPAGLPWLSSPISHLFSVCLDYKLLRGALSVFYFVKNSIALLLLLELEAGLG